MSQVDASLGPGKHPHCRIALSGVVRAETVRAVSKRLAFFTLQAHGAGTTFDQECLVKFRDGCLTEDEIAMLVAALSASDASGHHTHVQVKLLGFPELADDCLSHSVHVIQATVSSDADDETSARTFPEGDIREPLSEEKAPAVRRKQSGNHARPANANRHQQFVSWLIETYGRERLLSGAGVLDVAGGAGGIAFELAFRRGIPCVVIDPRPMKLNSRQRRALKNRANSQAVLSTAPPPCSSWWLSKQQQQHTAEQAELKAGQQGTAPTLPPGSVTRTALGDGSSTTTAPPEMEQDDALLARACEEEEEATADDDGAIHVPPSYAQAWAEEGISAGSLPRQIIGYLDEDFDKGRYAEFWRDVSVVVGMHPDQATEPAVRLALAHGKPFAVVPCCVFPKSNPGRRLRDGKAVETHEEFCTYLEQLGEAAQSVELCGLPFEGRNIVVHSRPPEAEEAK